MLQIKNQYLSLKSIDFSLLVLTILALPSFEAPKNIFAILFLVFATYRVLKENHMKSFTKYEFVLFGLLLSVVLSSFFAGISNENLGKGIGAQLLIILLGLIIPRLHYEKNKINWIFIITILSVLPPLIWGFLNYKIFHLDSALKIHSVGHVNHSAIYLCIISGATFAYIFTTWFSMKLIKKVLFSGLLIFYLACLMMQQSRAAFGAIFIIIALTILFLPNKNKIKLCWSTGLVTSIFLIFLFNFQIIQKISDQNHRNDNFAGRETVWNVSLEAARFNPIFGIGNGNWKLITMDMIQASVEKRGKEFFPDNYNLKPGHSHQIYLANLVERGLFGLSTLFIFMIFWIDSLYKSLKTINTSSSIEKYLWAASLSACVTVFIIGLVNTTFHHEHGILAMLFLSLHQLYLKNKKL